MKIRKAAGRELSDIQAIDKETFGNNSRKEFIARSIKAGRCLIALVSGKVAGFGILGTSFFNQGFIELLVVHSEYRRRGVATALIHCIEELCPAQKLFTSTNQSNIPAQKTYESNGFIRSGYIENLDEGDPEIIYFKHLNKK